VFSRLLSARLTEALSDTPAVIVIGPRQSGKSTFVRQVAHGRAYVTLDDPLDLARARANPGEFLDSLPDPVTIDEVQRAPELMLGLKLRIDRDRRPGRYLLTGSANVLTLPKVADSLAGRIEVLELLPLAQAEIEGTDAVFLERAFGEGWGDRVAWPADDVWRRIGRGGFPEPATRDSAARRRSWAASYVRTLLERDVRDLGNIEGLTEMPRLLTSLAQATGQAMNVDALSRVSKVPATTLRRYVDLLRAIFLVQLVPAWSLDGAAPRLAKTAKAYLVDSLLASYLLGFEPETAKQGAALPGALLEGFVANELARLCRAGGYGVECYHLRTVRQKEVPFVLEASGAVVGIALSESASLTERDWEGLEYLEALSPDRFKRGIVLYGGLETRHLTRTILALPYQGLWRP
jgi:predicted AAA+ superfamily ATPase